MAHAFVDLLSLDTDSEDDDEQQLETRKRPADDHSEEFSSGPGNQKRVRRDHAAEEDGDDEEDISDEEDDICLLVQTTGTNPLADFPHAREDCVVVPKAKTWNGRANRNYCINCYCYVCDEPAKDCKQWKDHCRARAKRKKWQQRRRTRMIKKNKTTTTTPRSASFIHTPSVATADSDSEDDDYLEIIERHPTDRDPLTLRTTKDAPRGHTLSTVSKPQSGDHILDTTGPPEFEVAAHTPEVIDIADTDSESDDDIEVVDPPSINGHHSNEDKIRDSGDAGNSRESLQQNMVQGQPNVVQSGTYKCGNEVAPDQPKPKQRRVKKGRKKEKRKEEYLSKLPEAPRVDAPPGYTGTLEQSNLRRSVGLTRALLRQHQWELGLTAKSAQQVFSGKDGKLSHLTFNSDWNVLPYTEDQTLKFWLGEGPGRLKQASSVDPANNPDHPAFPVFWAQPQPSKKKGGQLCHYIGHFRCINFDTSKKAKLKNEPRQALLEFKFVDFKVKIAEKNAKHRNQGVCACREGGAVGHNPDRPCPSPARSSRVECLSRRNYHDI